jgi:hypothetical protein
MEIILVTQKPRFGKFERQCHMCGDIYTGYHMYVCLECEIQGNYSIVEDWA